MKQYATMITSCERGPLTRSVASSHTNTSMQAAPAMLGSSARRRAADAVRQRPATIAATASAMTISITRCVVSTAP